MIPAYPTEGADGRSEGGGVRFHDRWAPPATVTRETVEAARTALANFDELLKAGPLGPAKKPGTRGHWLAQLAMLTISAGKNTLEEQLGRVATVAIGLTYPAFCFTSATLYQAARRFKFFPSFAELAAFLDEVVEPARRTRDRLSRLAQAVAGPGPRLEKVAYIRDLPDAERTRYFAEMRTLRAKLETAGVGNTPDAARARRARDDAEARMRARLQPVIEAERARFLGETDKAPPESAE